jgi:hypothetical protein
MRRSTFIVASVAVSADIAVLVGARPHPRALTHDLSAPTAWIDRVGPDRVAATVIATAVWLLAVWCAVATITVIASTAPGVLGRAARRLTVLVLPRVFRGAVAGTAAFGVAVAAPVAAIAQPVHAAGLATLPAPTLPISAHATLRPPQLPTTPAATRPAVEVHRGDTLWAISARALATSVTEPPPTPARIALAWPRWFAANRAVIGADPHRLRPGQWLREPSPPAGGDAS